MFVPKGEYTVAYSKPGFDKSGSDRRCFASEELASLVPFCGTRCARDGSLCVVILYHQAHQYPPEIRTAKPGAYC
jgi:hypothetical protein